MAKVTLQQKWDALQEKLQAVREERLDEFFKAYQKPEAIYECDRIGEILKREIVAFEVKPEANGCIKYPPYVPNGIRPNTGHIAAMHSYIEAFSVGISVSVIYRTTYGTTGDKYNDIGTTQKHLAFNESDLKALADERRELYAPREGYSPCAYCRKQVPTESLVPYKIIFQNSRWDIGKGKNVKFVDQKTLQYCSKECGVHDQMAHEG